MKNGKRILSVTVKQMWDEDSDASYLNQSEFEDRKTQFLSGQFDFVGARAEAEILIPNTWHGPNRNIHLPEHGTIQTITSGGLWGIESDSSPEYFREIEKEQLSELRTQLRAIGFSARAISTAFKTVKHEEL